MWQPWGKVGGAGGSRRHHCRSLGRTPVSLLPPLPSPPPPNLHLALIRGHADSQKLTGNDAAKLLSPLSPAHPSLLSSICTYHYSSTPTQYHSRPPPPPHSIVSVTRAQKAGVTPADTTGPEPTDTDMPPITMETLREKHPDATEEAAWVRGRQQWK